MRQPHYEPEPHILGWLQAFSLQDDVVLDVGCGDWRYQDIPVKKVWSLDSWPRCEPDYLMDLNNQDLPRDRQFSVVFLLDVLEHLEKTRSEEILRQAQELAGRAVVVLTPLWWMDNRETFEDPDGFYFGNENVLHRSQWTLDDFGSDWTRVILPSTYEFFFGYWTKT